MKKSYIFLLILISIPFISLASELGDGNLDGNIDIITDLKSENGYEVGQIIVKFKPEVAELIDQQIDEGAKIDKLRLNKSLKDLIKEYNVKKIIKVFKDFDKREEKITKIKEKIAQGEKLNKVDEKIYKKLEKVPEGVVVPDLSSILQIKLGLQAGQTIKDAVRDFANDASVEYAEPDYVYQVNSLIPNDPYFTDENDAYQWSLFNNGMPYPPEGATGSDDKDIDAELAWDITTGSDEVIVAVVDTGIDYNHRDLKNNMWINDAEELNGLDDDGNGYVDDIYGYDFYYSNHDPFDYMGHGTHCAGIIAAQGDNGQDIAGVSWNSKVMAIKVGDATGNIFISKAIEGIFYAIDNGADILSNSYGGPTLSQALQDTINYAYSQGVIFVAAAGNNSSSNPYYPAIFDNVLAVAATDSDDNKASFSNYGYWVDVAAPGVNILSLRSTEIDFGTPFGEEEYLTVASGTSMAAPHVSGVCALLLSFNPILTVDQMTEIIKYTGDSIADGICSSDKRINAYNALLSAISEKGRIALDKNTYMCCDCNPEYPPSTGTIPWIEAFELYNYTVDDNGETAWTRDISDCSKPYRHYVWYERFLAADTDGELVWLSEVIDISTAATVNVSMDIWETGRLEDSDYISVFYKLNGGSEILIQEYIDDFGSASVSETGISGGTIQIIMRCRNNSKSEIYFIDNVSITDGGGVGIKPNAITITVCDANVIEPSIEIDIYTIGDLETVTLNPAYGLNGVFSGIILTDYNIGITGDDILQIADGDQIYAMYLDDNYEGSGLDNIAYDYATADCVSPEIQSIDWDPLPVGPNANVNVTTDEDAKVTIRYGTFQGHPFQYENYRYGSLVEVPLSQINPETTYYFQVEAKDDAGNITIDNNNNEYYSFTTSEYLLDIIVYDYDDNEEKPDWADYNSIQDAIDVAWNGETVTVYKGQYNEQIDFKGKKITVRSAYDNDWDYISQTIIYFDDTMSGDEFYDMFGIRMMTQESRESVLKGFTIECSCVQGAIYCLASKPTINNCIIKTDHAGYGAYTIGGSPEIKSSIIDENYFWGIKSSNSKIEIKSCEFKGAGLRGIEHYSNTTGGIIANNMIHDYVRSGIFLTGSRVMPVKNNIIYRNLKGIELYYYDMSVAITGNTIVNNTEAGLYVRSNSGTGFNPVIHSCILWNNLDDISYLDPQSDPLEISYSCIDDNDDGIGVIHDDPLFIEIGNDNYHIHAGSPCFNTGNPYYVAEDGEVDIDGQDRILEGYIDIGADEI